MPYSMRAVCRLLDVKPDTLRKWESRGLVPRAARRRNGFRVFSEDDLRAVRDRVLRRAGRPAARPAGHSPDRFAADARRAARLYDRAALEGVFARALKAFGPAGAWDRVWRPLLHPEPATRSPLSVSERKFLETVGELRFARLVPSARRARRPAVLALSPGGGPAAGLYAAVAALERRGAAVACLGAGLDFEPAAAALGTLRPRAALFHCAAPLSRKSFRAAVRLLRRRAPRARLLWAGPGSLPLANLIHAHGGVFLGATLEIGLPKALALLKRRS